MNLKAASIGGMLAAVLVAPGIANASFVLDTGAPTSTSGGVYELLPGQWYAAEFTLANTENISSLAAYLEPLPSSASTAFQFDIYSGTNFSGTRVGQLTALDTTSATYAASGWNTTNVNYTLGPGTYWLALEVAAGPPRTVVGFDLPTTGISTSSGTAPAQAFAYYGGSSFNASNVGIGVQISASPVPLPGAVWLLGSALAGLGVLRRRRAPA